MMDEKQIKERYTLSIERIKEIGTEDSVGTEYKAYFEYVAAFILQIDQVRELVESGAWDELPLAGMQEINRTLYQDILEEHYETSFANPEYAVKELSADYGQLLAFLYTEIRGEIAYAYEQKLLYLTICNELFLEVYHSFEETEKPGVKGIRDILYWYVSDYCDVFLADRIQEQIDPAGCFAAEIIQNADLEDDRYLYRFGEYVSENELETARHLRTLSPETLRKMADVYTEGYRTGFVVTGKDLSKKSVVNIRYTLGFESMIRPAVENFKKMGLKPAIYRAAVSVITKKEQYKIGYLGAIANKQYEYDHRADLGLFLDKRLVERRLDVLRSTYEKHKEQAAQFAGPAVLETFGEKPFAPETKAEAPVLSEKQRDLSRMYESKSGQLVNQYIKGEERSFTIIAYPVPEIGADYPAIFDEVIRINTLDAAKYEQVQQKIIDALDQGEYVRILGKGDNQTELKVQLYHLQDAGKETIFENCVADVNIPVGEVFTSPVLEGTEGVLFVSRVYLNELQYRDLKLTFRDGKVVDYSCSNFENPEDGRAYIRDNILHSHETLPMGEFAIGTNTTAYVTAKKYGIEEKMPILIAEKMGPHFAVGDTCYSWSEDTRVYNPNGKEIVAKDNSISILRREDPTKAYFQCHTDITIPYEELEEICVVTKEGKEIIILKSGRFVLEGTEDLNEPLKELETI
ncbi:Leucyl aminopeptidase (aminopeptidase T) [Hespellia stercorisuis DSM 15480]|uniref:Leucyl aminopeptidase (Aminopeptidase T) n=2 Tax=Hespellia stercorisuis TaxID=180311 RepID=A0A1M6T0S4_9FIRM|nr:aminopeptidase [Hespellia stercorisuis]SHK50541.1 Leucyl aminopeptidase (aminopeptidase T) [Hespellia stercorisuis DSM 15480]